MAPFPDYNPNYEERRGRYASSDERNRLQEDMHAAGNRQNTSMPPEGPVQEPQQDDRDEQDYTDEA